MRVNNSKMALRDFPNFNFAMSAYQLTNIVETAVDDRQSTMLGVADDTKTTDAFAVKDEISNRRCEGDSFDQKTEVVRHRLFRTH